MKTLLIGYIFECIRLMEAASKEVGVCGGGGGGGGGGGRGGNVSQPIYILS